MPRPTRPAEGFEDALPTWPAALYVGTSGWAYPTWKPGFYPEKLPQRRFLEYFAAQMTAVEVNYTFRALPTAKTVEGWLESTPKRFRFTFKAPQRVSHFSRLRGCGPVMKQFLQAIEPVRAAGRLGTVLVQLPPTMKADEALLADFLQMPELAGEYAPRLSFEFRHATWLTDRIFGVLEAHNAALCVAHTAGAGGGGEDELEVPEVHTARTHTAFRLRRDGGYSTAELRAYAEHLRELAATRDVFVALRHQDEPTGALNARELLRLAAGAGSGA